MFNNFFRSIVFQCSEFLLSIGRYDYSLHNHFIFQPHLPINHEILTYSRSNPNFCPTFYKISQKLEQTVVGNARLEQELLVLRQKLQASRGARGSQSMMGSQGGAPDSIPYVGGTTAVLESELRRVQQLVGDMQRQRQELSQAVRQLTENSSTLCAQIQPKDRNSSGIPTSSSSSHIKKQRSNSTGWTETDLDSMYSIDHMGTSMDNLSIGGGGEMGSHSTTPLYIDTGSANSSVSILNCSTSSKLNDYTKMPTTNNYRQHESDGIESSGMESDDLLEGSGFANLSGLEKPEIKTVRIVKRESERRHRDRERGSISANSNSSQNLDHVLEEESQQMADDYSRSRSLPRTYMETHEHYRQKEPKMQLEDSNPFQTGSMYASSPAIPIKYTDYYSTMNQPKYPVSMGHVGSHHHSEMSSYLHKSMESSYSAQPPPAASAPEKSKNPFHAYLEPAIHQPQSATTNGNQGLRQKTESIQSLTKTIGSLSPIFQSEAARQIIIEMSGNTSEENNEKIPLANKQRRAVPREKRRHYTAPNTLNAKSMQNIQSENDMNKNVSMMEIVLKTF